MLGGLMMDYEKTARLLKALADSKRLKIVDILSCGTMCACDILEHFDFTQPTLSHHMKVLEKAGIVRVTKKGLWHYYELKETFVEEFDGSIQQIFSSESSCICQKTSQCTSKEETVVHAND